MTRELTIAAAGLAVGVAAVLGLQMLTDDQLEPETEPIVSQQFEVKLKFKPNTDPEQIIVELEETGSVEDGLVYKGDTVKFINETDVEVTISFDDPTDKTPFFGKPSFKVPAFDPEDPNVNVEIRETAVDAPEDMTDGKLYYYTVSPNGAPEQSPRVRIGPKRPNT